MAEEDDDTCVYVYDRRQGAEPPCKINLGGVFYFSTFCDNVKKALGISSKEKFIVCNTSRVLIDGDDTYQSLVNADDTLYVLTHLHQELSAPAAQRVEYVPHHDTIVKSGMYEYYASEGQTPLPFAFAELIDNALSATHGMNDRDVEVQLVFDDNAGHSIIVIDNGCGMSTRKLNDWAIYRLSKHSRHHSELSEAPLVGLKAPRSLNSDISYFGVGGKQAIFFIGSAVRMITREQGSDDVHELYLSKEGFDKKARERVPVYTGEILNRPPGDAGHIGHSGPSTSHLKKLIKSEATRPHFTAVVVTGVAPKHVAYLRHNFKHWCRQLAHLYHYYLHGPNGNTDLASGASNAATGKDANGPASKRNLPGSNSAVLFKKIDIKVSMFEKGKTIESMQLSDIDDDLQTRLIRSAVTSFEFTADVEGVGPVEGVLRYHPFLYDHETYPQVEEPTEPDNDEDGDSKPAARPMFECYWNGRLIPYTTVASLDWCQIRRHANIPEDCFRRISGVLWTDSHFQVSTNKLTFIDLPGRLQEKATSYSRVTRGVEQRCPNINRVFLDWLKDSHELFDKQVKFKRYQGIIKRTDVPQKRMQSPWAVFEAIEWDGKTFQKGQLVRIHRVIPVVLGRVKRFLLYGDHEEGDVFATGGEIEIVQEPASLYSDSKIYPLSKLDRVCTTKTVERGIAEEELKLPSKLDVTFPDGNSVKNNSKMSCDSVLGAIGVEILNGHGDPMSKLVGERQKQLMVEQIIVHHTHHGDKEIVKLCSRHGGKKWAYWFGAVEFRSTGNYTLSLQAVVGSDQSSSVAASSLPSVKIKFSVTEGKPVKFTVGVLEGPFRIGKPFQIPISLHDRIENRTPLPQGIAPALSASGMQVSFKDVSRKGGECIINNIIILGKVDSANGKDVSLSVQIPSLENPVQKMKIRLLPGPPAQLNVRPVADEDISLECGNPLQFVVHVQDAAGNPASDNRMGVSCKLYGASNLETLTANAADGTAVLSGVPNVHIKNKKTVSLRAVIDMPNHRNTVPSVERLVNIIPSCRPAAIQVLRRTSGEATSADSTEEVVQPDGEVKTRAGETLSGLKFRIIDEGGRQIELDNQIAGKMRVNWVARSNREQFKNGCLPDIKVPSTVGELKFCQVSLSGQHPLDASFSVEPLAGPIAGIKCITSSHIIRIDETASHPLIVTFHDEQGNLVKTVPDSFKSSCQLSGDNIKSFDKPDIAGECIKIRNLTFSSTKAGEEVVKVTVGEMSAVYTFSILAGRPAHVQIKGCQQDHVYTVYNNNRLPFGLEAQLFDKYRNPCALEGVRMQMGKSGGLKLSPPLQQQRTNSSGSVNFGFTSVQAERGTYVLTPRATYGQSTIFGHGVQIQVEPDPSKVVAVQIRPVEDPSCVVGGMLPELICYPMAEDGRPFAATAVSHIMMELLCHNTVVSTYGPSSAAAGDENGMFYFRNEHAPTQSGIFQARFTYNDGILEPVQSSTIDIAVHHGRPCKLVPGHLPSSVAVSNSGGANQRKIVQNLRLKLQDEHGNDCFDGALSGLIKVCLQGQASDPRANSRDVPTFEGGQRSVTLPLHAGECAVGHLQVAPDCPGEDGHRYSVTFSLDDETARRTNVDIPPFEFSFIFCNDGHKQRQLSGLAKRKDELNVKVADVRQTLAKHEQELQALTKVYQQHEADVASIKGKLVSSGISTSEVVALSSSATAIETSISQLRNQCVALENKPRRRCLVEKLPPHFSNDKDVIGKVAHLAFVEDDNVARALSWHMGNDMDCCIITNSDKAMSLNKHGDGQQLLPLDTIYKKGLPNWDRPLPHVRVFQHEPRGNPQYVRNYLMFPDREQECRDVFGLLLGEVIILDTLADATLYRKQLASHSRCPTLLTREGDRIRSTGKFGGWQNKAPPLHKIRNTFGAPPPREIAIFGKQIELLHTLHHSVTTMTDLKQRVQRKQAEMASPAYQERRAFCMTKEGEIQSIEQEIIALSPQPVARSHAPSSRSAASVTASPQLPRRGRQSSGASPATGRTPVQSSPSRGVRRTASQVTHYSPPAKRRR